MQFSTPDILGCINFHFYLFHFHYVQQYFFIFIGKYQGVDCCFNSTYILRISFLVNFVFFVFVLVFSSSYCYYYLVLYSFCRWNLSLCFIFFNSRSAQVLNLWYFSSSSALVQLFVWLLLLLFDLCFFCCGFFL